MKKLLIVCGAGHATSTIAVQGLPLLNGMGVDQVYDQLKTRLGL